MFRFPLPLLALTFAAAIVAASHDPVGRCDSDGQPALGIVEVTEGEAAATFYVDDRGFVLGYGVRIYQESNGIWTSQGPGIHQGDTTEHANLQRGGGCGGTTMGPLLPRSAAPPQTDCQGPPPNPDICTDVGDWDPDTQI